jgi:hypothetical protein
MTGSDAETVVVHGPCPEDDAERNPRRPHASIRRRHKAGARAGRSMDGLRAWMLGAVTLADTGSGSARGCDVNVLEARGGDGLANQA